jgi:hypothetical protein
MRTVMRVGKVRSGVSLLVGEGFVGGGGSSGVSVLVGGGFVY